MSSKEEEEIIYREIIKIIDSNKNKASSLRNSLLNINKNIYSNNLTIQIMQFLGEFEYDLKTLIELLNDFKKKTRYKHQKKLNSLKKENKSNKIEEINNKNNIIKNNKGFIKTRINQNIKKSKNSEKSQNQNLSQKNFYISKENIFNNNESETKSKFCDYFSFLNNLKRNNISQKNPNIIKYENYKQNNERDFKSIARGDNNNFARPKSVNSNIICKRNNYFEEERKQKIINDIFKDEKILNNLKSQFGNDIEDKLLNGDINYDFLLKVEEIINKIKKEFYYTPRNKSIKMKNENNHNRSYNLKIPKRFSNNKNDSKIDSGYIF